MKVSHQWLNEYVDLSHISIDRLSEIMTEIGLEVEGYEKVENIKGGLEGIVIGKVRECYPHPNADRLSLTKVEIGNGEALQIVCGAPNVQKDQTVPVATVGTTLYDNDGQPFTIKKGKIRGEVSEGMICSEDELGISDDHSGIMVLPEEYEIGKPLNNYIEVKEDYIIDIDLTPNRSDAMYHRGAAFDIAAYLKTNGEGSGTFKYHEAREIPPAEEDLDIDVIIEDDKACPRYSGIVLTNLEVKPSPPWLQERLQAIGVKPHNNVIDTTNFILHDMGQPLHAFDYDKIEGNTIRVKKLAKGTTFTTLDDQERELNGEELMICDGNSKPLCMAGIYGGKSSGVTDRTNSIFLESAYFDPKTIRKASMHHQLRTDAAKIYEKGADPNIAITAMQKAVEILQNIAGAKVASKVHDTLPQGMPRPKVQLHYATIRQYLGLDISEDDIKRILQNLNMEIDTEDDRGVRIMVPTNKPDVLREVDVIEEIIRNYGLDEIPVPDKFSLHVSPAQYPDNFHYRDKIAQALTGGGLHEAMSLSIVPSSWYKGHEMESHLVLINNTSNQDLNAMRPDLITCMLDNVRNNINRQQKNVGLFEFGKVYWVSKEDGYLEEERLSLMLSGDLHHSNWRTPEGASVDFYVLKSYVERIFELLAIEEYQISELEDNPYYSYGMRWYRGATTLAVFGKMRSSWNQFFDIDQEAYAAEISLEASLRAAQDNRIIHEDASKFPSIERDLSLILDEQIKYEEVKSVIYSVEEELIKHIELFDVYKNKEQLGEGKKSYAVRMNFESFEKTLKDKEIDQKMKKIIQALKKRLNAKLR